MLVRLPELVFSLLLPILFPVVFPADSHVIHAMVLIGLCILPCLPNRGAVVAFVQRLISSNGHVVIMWGFYVVGFVRFFLLYFPWELLITFSR